MTDSNPEPPSLAVPTFLTHRNCEIINVCCFKWLSTFKCSNRKLVHSVLNSFPVEARDAKAISLCRVREAKALEAMTKDRGYLAILSLSSLVQGQIIELVWVFYCFFFFALFFPRSMKSNLQQKYVQGRHP